MDICPKFLYGGPDIPWMNPQCVGINTLPPRTNLHIYPTEREAIIAEPRDSDWFFSLDGDWKFNLFQKPADLEPGNILPDWQLLSLHPHLDRKLNRLYLQLNLVQRTLCYKVHCAIYLCPTESPYRDLKSIGNTNRITVC